MFLTSDFIDRNGIPENAAKEAGPNTCFEDVSNSCTFVSWTQEFGPWRKIFTALDEYLYAAAVYAKSVNASSTAARLYLRAWRIVQRIEALLAEVVSLSMGSPFRLFETIIPCEKEKDEHG